MPIVVTWHFIFSCVERFFQILNFEGDYFVFEEFEQTSGSSWKRSGQAERDKVFVFRTPDHKMKINGQSFSVEEISQKYPKASIVILRDEDHFDEWGRQRLEIYAQWKTN